MKILLAVDDSSYSEAAVQDVALQGHPKETQVLVMHVIQPISVAAPPQMAAGYAPELDAEKRKARDLVERFAETLRRAGYNVETSVFTGEIEETILKHAEEWQPDLIVLGSHGRRGASRLLLGSVAEFVARHARCSVKIVRMPVAA
jgi:nucleotide-binding universal stress UspA family protein